MPADDYAAEWHLNARRDCYAETFNSRDARGFENFDSPTSKTIVVIQEL